MGEETKEMGVAYPVTFLAELQYPSPARVAYPAVTSGEGREKSEALGTVGLGRMGTLAALGREKTACRRRPGHAAEGGGDGHRRGSAYAGAPSRAVRATPSARIIHFVLRGVGGARHARLLGGNLSDMRYFSAILIHFAIHKSKHS